MQPCVSCFVCGTKRGNCFIKDDFLELRELWLKADVVIYSVPVYHMGIPGQLKCFIDRLGNSLFGLFRDLFPPGVDQLPKQMKVIGNIAQGAHLFAGQEHTITGLINHTMIMQCIPVTGDMWESYIGAGGWTAKSIDRNAIRDKNELGQEDVAMAVRGARVLGKRAVELALILRAGAQHVEEDFLSAPEYRPFIERVGS